MFSNYRRPAVPMTRTASLDPANEPRFIDPRGQGRAAPASSVPRGRRGIRSALRPTASQPRPDRRARRPRRPGCVASSAHRFPGRRCKIDRGVSISGYGPGSAPPQSIPRGADARPPCGTTTQRPIAASAGRLAARAEERSGFFGDSVSATIIVVASLCDDN
jgi:hypothetical protein